MTEPAPPWVRSVRDVGAPPDPSTYADAVVFDPAIHGEMIRSWARRRELPELRLDLLPPTGRIVPDLAVGFMYRTDTPIAFIESFVANPDADAAERDAAIDRVVHALFDDLRAAGCELIWGWTARDVIVARARKHGFRVSEQPYTFVARAL